MTENLQSLSPSQAVTLCWDAYFRALKRPPTPGSDPVTEANRAYRQTIPIVSLETLHAFIACVAQAMVTEIMTTAEVKILLYATQIIFNTRPREPKPTGRPPKTTDILNKTQDQVSHLASSTVNHKINTPSPLPAAAEPAIATPKPAARAAKPDPVAAYSAPKTGKGIQWRLD